MDGGLHGLRDAAQRITYHTSNLDGPNDAARKSARGFVNDSVSFLMMFQSSVAAMLDLLDETDSLDPEIRDEWATKLEDASRAFLALVHAELSRIAETLGAYNDFWDHMVRVFPKPMLFAVLPLRFHELVGAAAEWNGSVDTLSQFVASRVLAISSSSGGSSTTTELGGSVSALLGNEEWFRSVCSEDMYKPHVAKYASQEYNEAIDGASRDGFCTTLPEYVDRVAEVLEYSDASSLTQKHRQKLCSWMRRLFRGTG
eukprot:ANDGO_04614.mRNA.1 hypothetical protein